MAVVDKLITTDEESWSRYLPVTPKVKSLGAYVRGAGFASVSPHSLYPPPSYKFVYITHGSGVSSSRSQQNEPVRAGDLIIVFPRVWHHYRPLPDTGWREYWIEFAGDYIRRLMNQTGFTSDAPVQYIGIHDSILDLFLKALAWLKNEPPEYPLLLGSLAAHMIAQVLSTAKGQSQNSQSDAAIIREARRWLIHDLGSAENLSDLASQLNVSYSTFRHRFKAETGISPRQFALDARIRKASNLLVRTGAAPRAIAKLCGMESHYFSRWFKKKIGLTPTAYRQRHRKPIKLSVVQARLAAESL